MTTGKQLYKDTLVCISGDSITFFRYSLFLRKKTVPLSEIDHIDVKAPTVMNGKWRLWGTGNFTIWFPLDVSRPSRDRIFIATFRNQRMQIGFTVENSLDVIHILRSCMVDVRE